MSLRVLTLPGLRLLKDGVEVRSLAGRRRPLALLVYLAVERRATRDVLLGLLWPERDEAHARQSLRQALHELRRALGNCLEVGLDTAQAAPDLETDLARFESAAEAGRCAEALELYGGAFLEGVFLAPTHAFEEWVERRRLGAARRHRSARRQVVATRLAADDPAGALVVAERWAEVEPLDEEAQLRTMELLARLGRRTEALQQYERFRDRLHAEQLAPLPELAALAGAIAAGRLHPVAARDRSAAAVAPPEDDAAHRHEPAASPEPQAKPAWGGDTSGRRPSHGRNAPRQTVRRAALPLLAAALIVAAFLGLPRLSGVELGERRPALAVLPFDNLSPDATDAYLAAGMQEEILAHLSRIASLRLVSRTSVLAYDRGHRNIRGIAGELGTRYVLEGSIRRAGDRIRVTVELVDARSDAHLWVDSYEGDVANILTVQASVADQVACVVEARLAPPRRTPLDSGWTITIAARDFLRAAVRGARTEDREEESPLRSACMERPLALAGHTSEAPPRLGRGGGASR